MKGKTLADYVAIAISPLLIMALVGSLTFFLLEVSYSGQYESRMRWILFWFVLASVLVSRIGIEQGREYASLYGAALAAATALVVFRLAPSYAMGGLCLLAVIWWCTGKLTWDCTLIDDREDASGEGLLQVSGLDDTQDETAGDGGPPAVTDDRRRNGEHGSAAGDAPPRAVPLWQRLFVNRAEREGRPHAPGLWVVYFSLAALPLFGIGQLLIPAVESGRREYAFQLLAIYVAAGLGLLLTTSFLNLRRYLRQRKLKMPLAMTGTWIVTGTALIALILGLCLLLPRPDAQYSLAQGIDKVSDYVERKASQHAFLRREAGQGTGDRRGPPADEDRDRAQDAAGRQGEEVDGGQGTERAGERQEQGDGTQHDGSQGDQDGEQESQQERSSAGGDSGGQQRGAGEPDQQADRQADQRGQQARREQQQQDQQGPDQQQAQPENARQREGAQQDAEQQDAARQAQQSGRPSPARPSPPPNPARWIGTAVKWLIYAILAGIVLYFVLKNWSRLREALLAMIEGLRNFWSNLFGGRPGLPRDGAPSGADHAAAPQMRFADYANPYSTGLVNRMPTDELLRHTFEALQAWGREHGAERSPDQTPLEFARDLGSRFPALERDVRQFARLYAALAYAGLPPADDSLKVVERLWRHMDAAAAVRMA